MVLPGLRPSNGLSIFCFIIFSDVLMIPGCVYANGYGLLSVVNTFTGCIVCSGYTRIKVTAVQISRENV